jgi:hypothetical protein
MYLIEGKYFDLISAQVILSDTTEMGTMILADLNLARRLERAEGYACAMSVEARARFAPGAAASWIEVDGAYAMYDAPGSPINQTFGLGLFEDTTAGGMNRIEAFFRERGEPVHHETSPVAGRGLLALLVDRGYRPIEYSSVMYRPLDSLGAQPRGAPVVRVIGPDEYDLWAGLMARAWSDSSELGDVIYELCRVGAEAAGKKIFLAELDGIPVAGGALCLHGGVGLLAGAATVPEARRRGAQAALLDARLRYAAESGCDVAMMTAEHPGGGSQRNAERSGFRIAYTRVKYAL